MEAGEPAHASLQAKFFNAGLGDVFIFWKINAGVKRPGFGMGGGGTRFQHADGGQGEGEARSGKEKTAVKGDTLTAVFPLIVKFSTNFPSSLDAEVDRQAVMMR